MSDIKPQTSLIQQKKDAVAFLDSDNVRAQIAKVLPKFITSERMARVALTAVLRSPDLISACTHPLGKASLLDALMRCSQVGLEPDGRLAHLIPFWNSKGGFYAVQVIFDWKGLVTLAQRNGYDTVYPEMVCREDEFDAWVENGVRKILHRINYKKPRGEPYLFYCVSMRNGVLDYEIMTIEECDSIRGRSKAGDKGPWVSDTNEMRKKCPIRRISKRWELLPEIREALMADDDVIDLEKGPKVSAPLFGKKEPQQVVDLAEPIEIPTASVAEIRALCASSKIQEAALIEYLAESGVIDKQLTTLEAIKEHAPSALGYMNVSWASFIEKFNAWVEASK